MHKSEKKKNIGTIEEDTIEQISLPQQADTKISTSKQDSKNINPFEEATTSNKSSPILTQDQSSQFEEIALTTILPEKKIDLQSNSVQNPNKLEEHLYEELSLPTSSKVIYNEPRIDIYESISPKIKFPKKSSNNKINTAPNRSPSQEVKSNDFNNLNLDQTTALQLKNRNTPSNLPLLYNRDNLEQSLITNNTFDVENNIISKNKKIKRVFSRIQYAIQQKEVVISGTTAIVLSTSITSMYLQDKIQFTAFFINSPLYTIVPIIAIASLFTISPIFLGIKKFINTKEHQVQGKNANEVLDNVLKQQPRSKAIKAIRLEYSNNTHSNFVINAWETKKCFVNIDKKVINKTNKIKSLINDRPIFTTLVTGVVIINTLLPLLLYIKGGINDIQNFYQNPLTNNIKLLSLICIGMFTLLTVYIGIHYYRKTNCTNLIFSEETIDPKNVNEKFIEEIKLERINVLEDNHSKDAKCNSLVLEQVVVQSHNYKDVIYNVIK